MPSNQWDVVIVGGGLSGLSLAVELAQPAFSHLRILVLEKRDRYTRDRTWSYWATQAHRYMPLERKRWHQWCVQYGERRIKQKSDQAYCTIDADKFYDYAQAQIDSAAHVELRLGTSVKEIVDANQPLVVFEDGTQISSAWIMDARPDSVPAAQSLFQHFLGWEVQTEVDCFNDDMVALMDFQAASLGLHFFYILPYSPRSALVETTWVSNGAHVPDYQSELETYLRQRFGITDYQQVYQEQGKLSLQTRVRQTSSHRVIPLGRGAGTLRPSTGFAFMETIADAQRIARCFNYNSIETVVITPYQQNQVNLWMDKVFFQAMTSNWSNAPDYFMALFEGVEPHSLVAFLSGHPSFAQRLTVAMQLPKLPFLCAGMRSITA
jgi:lycopene beta-cyclase